MKIRQIITALLLFGIVDQISDNTAVIEYEKSGRIHYTAVDLDMSACLPKEGEKVAFYRDYKIVTCGISY